MELHVFCFHRKLYTKKGFSYFCRQQTLGRHTRIVDGAWKWPCLPDFFLSLHIIMISNKLWLWVRCKKYPDRKIRKSVRKGCWCTTYVAWNGVHKYLCGFCWVTILTFSFKLYYSDRNINELVGSGGAESAMMIIAMICYDLAISYSIAVRTTALTGSFPMWLILYGLLLPRFRLMML